MEDLQQDGAGTIGPLGHLMDDNKQDRTCTEGPSTTHLLKDYQQDI